MSTSIKGLVVQLLTALLNVIKLRNLISKWYAFCHVQHYTCTSLMLLTCFSFHIKTWPWYDLEVFKQLMIQIAFSLFFSFGRQNGNSLIDTYNDEIMLLFSFKNSSVYITGKVVYIGTNINITCQERFVLKSFPVTGHICLFLAQCTWVTTPLG